MRRKFNVTFILWVFLGSLLLILTTASPAMANQPPELNVFFAEVVILPLMIGLCFLGGFYTIKYQHSPKWAFRKKEITTVCAIVLSTTNEGIALLVAMIFSGIAIKRGMQMIYWGILAAVRRQNTPSYLQSAKLWRLLLAGVLLIPTTVFFTGMSYAFQTHFVESSWWRNEHKLERLQEFTTYHFVCAEICQYATGERRFPQIMQECPPYGFDDYFMNKYNVRINYDETGRHFIIYMPPKRVPFFPYNYISPFPTYRADETGQIRMIRVHHKDQLCPADAPIVMTVTSEDIEKMKNEILTQNK